MARHAGVSTASISRTLNNPESVSVELRSRVDAAIAALGYIPDAAARALSSRRTRTIGAIVPTIDNAMFARGIEALQSHLSLHDYLLLSRPAAMTPMWSTARCKTWSAAA